MRRRVLLAGMAFLALLALAGALVAARGESSDATPENAVVVGSTGGLYEVTVSPRPEESQVNRLHSWQLEVRDGEGEPVAGATIGVTGDMPAHGHGLPTQPLVRELGDGRYAVDGVKFQMGGTWYVELQIAADAGHDVARVDFVLAG